MIRHSTKSADAFPLVFQDAKFLEDVRRGAICERALTDSRRETLRAGFSLA